MKWALLTAIRLYWWIIPEMRRHPCLFKETCSCYVYRHTTEYGFFRGASALKSRLKKCRSGYQLYTGNNGFEMKLADGSIIDEEEISPNLLNPITSQVMKILEQIQMTNNLSQERPN